MVEEGEGGVEEVGEGRVGKEEGANSHNQYGLL